MKISFFKIFDSIVYSQLLQCIKQITVQLDDE